MKPVFIKPADVGRTVITNRGHITIISAYYAADNYEGRPRVRLGTGVLVTAEGRFFHGNEVSHPDDVVQIIGGKDVSN